jgi:hypothetical protein
MVTRKDKNKIIVKKIPLDYYPERYDAYFQTMPILYLELLENKDKVKKDLRLKEYVPPLDRMEQTNNVPTTIQAESQVNNEIDKDFELKEYEEDNTIMKRIGKKNIKILDLTDLPEDNVTKDSKDVREKENKESKERYDEEKIKEYVIKDNEKTEDEIREEEIKRRLEKRYNKIKDEYVKSRSKDKDERRKEREERREEKYTKYLDENKERINSREERINESREERRNERREERREERSNSREERREERSNSREERREERSNSRDKDNIRDTDKGDDESNENKDEKNNKISEMFDKDKGEDKNDVSKKIIDMFSNENSVQNNQNNNSYQFTQQQQQNTQPKDNKFIPPTLSEINNGIVKDNKGVRDVTVGMSKKEDQDDEERRVLYDKFSILKKKYKEYKIPEFSPYADINVLRRTYDSAVKQLHLDYTVENYKKYLIGGFSLTQWLVTKFVKIDMTGFAEQQILSINQYEQVLIEIGEKSYFKAPSQMAPEFKLLMLIGFNVVIFVISKMIFKSTGDNIMSSINKLNEKKESSSSSNAAQKPHMRGPSMDDLADLQKSINGNKTKKE